MSQFNFTAEDDALVVTALQYLAEVQAASHGAVTDEVKALLAKIAEQQTPNIPVVEEKPAKAKKAKAEEAEPAAEEAPAGE